MAIAIGLVSAKGGTGKTTLACCLAEAFAAHFGGMTKIGLLDADPQKSAWQWSKRYSERCRAEGIAEIVDAAKINQSEVAAALTVAKENSPAVVLDTAGILPATTQALVAACDLILVPSRPQRADLDSLAETLRRLGPEAPAAVIMCQVPPARREEAARWAGMAASAAGMASCPVVVGMRLSWSDTMARGGTPLSLAVGSKAASEQRALADWALAAAESGGGT